MSHDVFICHSSEDRTIANAICSHLEQNRIRCWIAPRDVVPGSDYAQSIVEAIAGTRLTLLVFSHFSNHSPHVKREIERSVSHGIPILPFRVEDVVPSPALEYFISDSHWLDAVTPPIERHLDYLAGTMRMLLDRQSAAGAATVGTSPQAATSAADPPPANTPPPVTIDRLVRGAPESSDSGGRAHAEGPGRGHASGQGKGQALSITGMVLGVMALFPLLETAVLFGAVAVVLAIAATVRRERLRKAALIVAIGCLAVGVGTSLILGLSLGSGGYGDDPALDALWDSCEAGDMAACDTLLYRAPVGSEYGVFGSTCGGRTDGWQLSCSDVDG